MHVESLRDETFELVLMSWFDAPLRSHAFLLLLDPSHLRHVAPETLRPHTSFFGLLSPCLLKIVFFR